MMPASFEHIHETHQIALHISIRIFQRVAHAGLCGEVKHAFRAHFGEQLLKRIAVGDVRLNKSETGMCVELREPGLLEARIVVIIQVVNADHLMAFCQQSCAAMHADKASGACHENG